MTGNEAYDNIIYYLKSHFIKFYEDDYENKKRLTMAYKGYVNCPNMALESCVYFHSDCMECRVYYTKLGSDICKNSAHQAEFNKGLAPSFNVAKGVSNKFDTALPTCHSVGDCIPY